MLNGGVIMNQNIDTCVKKITKKSKGLLSEKEVGNFLVNLYENRGRNIEAGTQNFDDVMKDIDFEVLQKKKIARIQKANTLKSFLIKKQGLRKLRARKPKNFQDVKNYFNEWFRQAEPEEQALEETYMDSLMNRLDDQELREDFDSHAHADDIAEELSYQQVRDLEARPNEAVGVNKNPVACSICQRKV